MMQVAKEWRLLCLVAGIWLATSFAAAASITLSVEFTEFCDRIAHAEDFIVGHVFSGQNRLRANLKAVSMKFPCQSASSASKSNAAVVVLLENDTNQRRRISRRERHALGMAV